MNENDDLVNGRWSINLYAAIDYNFYIFRETPYNSVIFEETLDRYSWKVA